MQLSVDLSHIPIFFLFFYVLMPVAIYMIRGGFWARIYILFSSMVGAIFIYSSPVGFIELLFPDWIPDSLKSYYISLFKLASEPILMSLAAAGFILLFLFQYGLIKLVSMTGWGGASED
mgnify:CR=1 FL=1